MKIFTKYFLITVGLLFCTSCTKDIHIETAPFEKKLIIEGYIENDAYAWVVLTTNLAYFDSITPVDLNNIFITDSDATVIVDDGIVFDTLQFEWDSLVLQNKMVWPPVRFVGKKIKGEVGKSYNLKVLYEDKSYTATTSIQQPYHVDSVWFLLDVGQDSLGYIHTLIHDNPAETNYYRYHTKRIGRDFYYTPGLMSIWDDRYFNGMDFEFVLWRGRSIEEDYGDDDPEDTYFRLGDTVSIKSCMMDYNSYWYWKTLGEREALSNINPKNSVLGVWCGYGTAYYTFVCEIPSH